jgi:hypothetical protein
MSSSLSARIVEAVIANSNKNMREVPPLYNVIDPDHLNQLIESMNDGTVSFTYADHDVTVTGDGEIAVSDSSSRELTSIDINCED